MNRTAIDETFALTFNFGRPHTVSPDAGRNDHTDDDWQEDETAEERAADYRKAIIHDSCEAGELAAQLLESGALQPLIVISRTDPAHAGTLFAQIMTDLIEKRADLLSQNDSGNLIEFQPPRSFQSYEMQFEEAREAVRKGI